MKTGKENMLSSVPSKKFYTEQMLALLRTDRMQLRNHVDT